MANQLKIHLNVNEILTKDIRKGKATQFLEITVDGLTLGKIGNSHNFYVEDGRHNVHLKYHYESWDGSNFTCHSDIPCVVSEDDCDITVNVYFLNVDKIDFVKGIEPFNAEKAKSKGCYVATCVYGSYDCPEVWTLRRFRDNTLGATWYGRLFIYTYYAISPTLVKWFGHTKWFKKMWKGTLDQMVSNLRAKGIEDTPYNDKNW